MKIKPAMAAVDMRCRAEAALSSPLKAGFPGLEKPESAADTQRLLHELQVHQIELEMQNTELRQIRDELEASLDNYTDLYDFAPVGYFTLAADGVIQQVNLTGANLMGVDRAHLIGRGFDQLMPAGLRREFQAFLKKVFAGPKQSGDFEILRAGQPPKFINIEARCLLNRLACRVVVVDATQRKQTDEKVRVSEVRYRRLFEAAHDGVLLLDSHTRKITDANPFMTKLLGYPHVQLVGKELFEIGLLKDEAASQEMFRKLKRSHEVRYEDLPLKNRSGRQQEVEVVANLYQEDGHVVIQCNIRDITARKLAEHELAEKARLLDLSHDAIIVRDMQGHIRYWNHGAEELYGWARKEVMGKVSHRLLRTKFPVPLKQMTEELQRTDRWVGELMHTCRDGSNITVLARKTLDRDRQGRPVAVLENITNITKRKLAESALRTSNERYRTLFELGPVAVYSCDASGLIQDFNARAVELWGRQPVFGDKNERFCGSHKLYRPDGRFMARSKCPMVDVLTGKVPNVTDREVILERPDATRRNCIVNIRPLLNQYGEITGAINCFYDITDRKAAEVTQRRIDVLAASNQKLEAEVIRRVAVEKTLNQSQQLQTRLLAEARLLQAELRQLSREVLRAQEEERKRISRELHDVIAQTLTGINLRLASLKKKAGHNTVEFDRNLDSTQQLVAKSVNSVQQFARELRPSVLDDLGLIPALHTYLKDFAARTGLQTSLAAFSGVEKIDITKRTALFRIAQEALTNVSRHAHASRVDVSLHKSARSLSMKIKDDGKSFQVQNVLRAEGRKRLGLLGMRERIEMVGGTLGVESSPGKGTTIQVAIPLTNLRGGR